MFGFTGKPHLARQEFGALDILLPRLGTCAGKEYHRLPLLFGASQNGSPSQAISFLGLVPVR